jgi:hypothetical protein
MNHYKSWSDVRKRLDSLLCEKLKDRVDYFLTHYNKVHDAYGRAAIRLDGKDIVCFSWINMYIQEEDLSEQIKNKGYWDYNDPELVAKWAQEGTYCEGDFLEAALDFLNLPIDEALNNESYLIRLFAIMDRRVGKRTLKRIVDEKVYLEYPKWIRQFYELRLSAEGLIHNNLEKKICKEIHLEEEL